MVLRNQWYVAAWDDEVTGQPLGRVLCGEPVVMYRGRDGEVRAMEDACPHRLLPLSLGLVEGDAIRCRYHGLLLDGGGRCVEMPGGDPVNPHVRARTYPVVERYRFVWVWIGDPALADAGLLPDLWMNEHPDWRADGGTFRVECNHQLLIDNLMDLSHETYVHSTSIGQKEIHDVPMQTRVEDGEVISSRWMPAISPPPLYKLQLEGYAGLVDRWQICRFIPPGGVLIDVGVAPVALGSTLERHDLGGVRSFVLDFITPEHDGSCHYFWGSARNRDIDDDEKFGHVTQLQRGVFLEDVEVLEAQQRNIDLLSGRVLRAFSVDAGGVRARLMVDRLARDAAGEAAPS